MKKYFLKITTLFLFVAVLSSCDEDKVFFNNKQSLVGFNGVSANLPAYSVDDNRVFTLKVEVGSSEKVNYDRTFAISINDKFTTATPAQYVLQQTSLVIPANQYVGTIDITGVYDALPANYDEVLLSLDLVSVQDSDVVNPEKTNYTISLYRSCEIEIPLVYAGTITGAGSATAPYDVTFTKVEGADNTWAADNFWGDFVAGATGDDSYAGQYPYPGTLRIKCNNAVLVTGTSSNGAGGTGTFNPTTKVITLKLNQSLFTNLVAGVTLTPKQ